MTVNSTAAPLYIIEYMGDAPTWPACDRISPIPALCLAPRYRITAVSEGAGRAQVLLQTNYIKQ
ncbi:pilus assembly protein [Xanthomonas hortorum]|uniref:pilus assembly protein n=1 Tax=Xanthomonas hortorum TaxID=56454 RepID=UPI003CCF1F42